MTKLKVYIDFEAISPPFNYILNRREDVPYAYSMGIKVGKKFKVKTYVVNFNTTHTDNVIPTIKNSIIKNIRSIIENNNFKVDSETTQFYAFASNLEKKVLDRMFNEADVKDISKGMNISLERVTEPEFGEKEYFYGLKKAVKSTLDDSFIQKRGLKYDGALAALAGHLLFSNATGRKSKFTFKIIEKDLLKEIRDYSKDDVLRMEVITDDFEKFSKRYETWKDHLKETNIIRKNERNINTVLTYLKDFDATDSIESVIKKLKDDQISNEEKLKRKITFKK